MLKREKPLKPERVILLMLSGALLILVIFFGSILLQTQRELSQFQEREARLEAKLRQAELEFNQKEGYLGRLVEDPEFLERVARDRLGYTRPDEILFRFTPE
ncbi:MAG: septum formation initiator family protein [Verrucomicrobia bacterium]|nr:septum formation initiator family protein [Verrucomicrobiota bacterium]